MMEVGHGYICWIVIVGFDNIRRVAVAVDAVKSMDCK